MIIFYAITEFIKVVKFNVIYLRKEPINLCICYTNYSYHFIYFTIDNLIVVCIDS